MSDPAKFERVSKPDFPSDKNICFCVWRKSEQSQGKILLHFVEYKDVALDDLIFCDSPNFSGYAKIVDFVRNPDDTISDYVLKDAELDFDDSMNMAKITNQAIYDYMDRCADGEKCVVVCLRSKAPKK